MGRSVGFLSIALVAALVTALLANAHETPVKLPAPESAGEAWNVIEQSKANVDQLLNANLMRDIGAQLANISGALRVLQDKSPTEAHDLARKLLTGEVELLRDSREPVDAQIKTKPAWAKWCKSLSQLEALFPPATVHAQVYICPMHPMERHLSATEKCSLCGMALVRRQLPASGVYQKPGDTTLKLTATCAPLTVGQPTTAILRLTKPDGSPVTFADLVEVHTRKLHLLINDRSLSDYHHEHPQPTDVPGEYRFTFTPTKPGPYRIWADVVPTATGVQEYVIADLPTTTTPEPIIDRHTRLTSIVDGRWFELAFDTAGGPIRARQTVIGTITVSSSDGKPFTALEPIMGAFAHIVGFSEDGKSILHIHPYGKEPANPDDRAGPTFAFKFYAPAAGFLRLYCQVHVNGADVFVPFNLTVLPDN